MNSTPNKAAIIRGMVKIDELAASGHIFHRYSEELYPIVILGSTSTMSQQLGFDVPFLRGARAGTFDLVGYFRKLAVICGYRVIQCGEKVHDGRVLRLYRII